MATTEERLAALEAKLAQLTATTPTTYYTHQYSGEEIDAATGRALTGGALDTSVTNVSNQLGTFVRPNLLDNWYFGRPVNQRGQTEYAGNGYTIDRWRAGLKNIIASNKYITLQPNGMYSQIFQPFDLQLAGKIVTMSALIRTHSNHNIGMLLYDYVGQKEYSPDFIMTPTANQWMVVSTSFSVEDNAPDKLSLIFYPDKTEAGAQTVDIIAAKLELGPTQTLAHREGDKWVLNEVPDYGEQLRRCQRYYIKYDTIKANGYISNAAKSYYMPIFLPEALRTTPTILGTPKIRVRFNGGYSSRFVGGTFTAPDSWRVTVISANAVTLEFNVNTAVDPNNIPVSIELEGLELSADL